MARAPSDALIVRVLKETRTIAMVGASPNPVRPSYFVMKYLQDKGFRVIPVNPAQVGRTILGETVYARLTDIPAPVDMVDIFRASADVGPIVDEAIAIKAKVVWMQLGVVNEEAALRAEAAGLIAIVDRCPKMEFGRLSGEMGWLGVASRIIDNRPKPLGPSATELTRTPIGKGRGTL